MGWGGVGLGGGAGGVREGLGIAGCGMPELGWVGGGDGVGGGAWGGGVG